MHIDQHRLVADDIVHRTSPNNGGPFPAGAPDTLVLHYTAGDSADWAIDKLCDPTPGGRVSAHLVVGRDNTITQLLPFDTIAWHAGRSAWGGRSEFNNFSVGIEIDNAGRLTPVADHLVSWKGTRYDAAAATQGIHPNESAVAWWHVYPEAQIDRVRQICQVLRQTYPVRWIVGHEEISPGRKDDPGPAFPLDDLRRDVLGGPMTRYDAGEDIDRA